MDRGSREASEEIADAVAVLRRGGLVAFPTETVYGLGCDAEQPEALRRLYAVKRRPPEHPVIVHLASAADLDEWAIDVSSAARTLAAACWPGPLTLVVKRSARVPDEVTGGRDTVGLRVPGATDGTCCPCSGAVAARGSGAGSRRRRPTGSGA